MSDKLATGLDRIGVLAREGKKIEAIKRYREMFSVGLKEAKDAVEGFRSTGRWPSDGAPRETNTSHGAARETLPIAPALPSQQNKLAKPGASSTNAVAPESAAHTALFKKYGSVKPLAAVPAECSLYDGVLFVTAERILFVADRFGTWEITEDLSRAELEQVEARAGALSSDLHVRAGFHSVHFSDLTESAANALCQLLLGETTTFVVEPPAAENKRDEFAHPAPSIEQEFSEAQRALVEHAGSPPASVTSSQAVESITLEKATSSGSQVRTHVASRRQVADTAATSRHSFRLHRVVFLTLLASIPGVLMGSAWRVVPLDDFPYIAFSILLWCAVGAGGLVRGKLGPMLQAGFVAGLVDWVFLDVWNLYESAFASAFVFALLTVRYAFALSVKPALLWGLVLAVPAAILEQAVYSIQQEIQTSLPSTAPILWLVLFTFEEWQSSRGKLPTKPTT